MIEQTITTTASRTFRTQLVATEPDGFHRATSWPVTIQVHSHPQGEHDLPTITDEGFDQLRAWIGTYLADKDLTYALDMAPTCALLARYLLTVFTSLTPGVAAVAVSFPQTGETVRAVFT